MQGLTLRQLRYAQTLSEVGHFGRAAARCHVSQSALSQQIRLLEDRCGAPIFDRLGKSVRPTPFGRDFLSRAAQVLAAARDLEIFADMAAGPPSRPLRFGLIPTAAPYLLPDILPALSSGLPDTHFSVSEGKTDRLVAALVEGDLDLALIATDPSHPALQTAPLFEDLFVLAAGRGTAPRAPIDLSALPRERFLLLEEGHCLRDQMVDACALSPDLKERTFSATSLTTILELVANGYGMTLLPAISLRRERANPRIEIVPLAPPGPGRLLRLAWRSGSPYEPLFRRIAAIVAKAGISGLTPPPPPAVEAEDRQ